TAITNGTNSSSIGSENGRESTRNSTTIVTEKASRRIDGSTRGASELSMNRTGYATAVNRNQTSVTFVMVRSHHPSRPSDQIIPAVYAAKANHTPASFGESAILRTDRTELRTSAHASARAANTLCHRIFAISRAVSI